MWPAWCQTQSPAPWQKRNQKKDAWNSGWLSHYHQDLTLSTSLPLLKAKPDGTGLAEFILPFPPTMTTIPSPGPVTVTKNFLGTIFNLDFFTTLTEFLSVSSGEECSKSVFSPGRKHHTEKLTAALPSFLLQTQKEWGPSICRIAQKSFCVRCVCLWVSLWKLWSSPNPPKPYPRVLIFGTEGTSRLELAERRLSGCQDLDLRPSGHSCWGDWALFPRGMCHHPTASPLTTGDGWDLKLRGAHSHAVSFHWSLLPLCPGALPVFSFSSAFCPLCPPDALSQSRLPGHPTGENCSVSAPSPWMFLTHKTPQNAGKCLRESRGAAGWAVRALCPPPILPV